MGRRSSIAAVALLLWVATTDAYAQHISVVTCSASMVASLGVSGTGDRNAEPAGHSADTAATFELPVSGRWSARVDAGAASWTFLQRDPLTEALLHREGVRLSRVTFSAIQRVPDCGSPFRPYGGFGFGIYRYRFQDQRVAVDKGGIHGVAGVDVMVAEKIGITAELGIHAIGGPGRDPVFSTVLWSLRATLGARIMF